MTPEERKAEVFCSECGSLGFFTEEASWGLYDDHIEECHPPDVSLSWRWPEEVRREWEPK